MSSLSASIFRRGGPKRELFDEGSAATPGEAPAGLSIEHADRQQLEAELQQQLDILSTPKAGREWSAAVWRPDVGAAELVLTRRQTAQPMGYKWRRRQWLHPEEAAYLVDRSDLLLFVQEEQGQQQQQQQGQQQQQQEQGQKQQQGQEVDRARGRRLLSLQETFELMVMAGVSMERYILYSTLSRSGYLIMRYPSCWVVDGSKTPAHVWGHGAWRGCTGLRVAPLPGGAHAVCEHGRALHQGRAPLRRCVLEGEEGQGDEAPAIGGQPDGQQPAATGAQPKGQEQQQVDGQAAGAHPEVCGDSVAPQRKRARPSVQGWIGGSSDPGPGNEQQVCGEQGQGQTVGSQQAEQGQAASEAAGRWWPALNELPMMRPRGAQGDAPAGGGTCVSVSPAPRHAVELPARDVLEPLCPRLRPLASIPAGVHLPGPEPSPHAYLVYDVYQPGSHLARNKRVFPEVACHVAVCSARPPTLADLRRGDAQALTSAVPVKWAAVEGGIVTLYELGESDILRLV